MSKTLFRAAIDVLLRLCPPHLRFTIVMADTKTGDIYTYTSCCPNCAFNMLSEALAMMQEPECLAVLDDDLAEGFTDGKTLQ